MRKDRGGEFNWPYSVAELWADGIVHALGVVLALSGAVVFLVVMSGRASATELMTCGVYLATLVLSIAASAAYNVWPVSRTKWLLRRLDHSAIFLLIAGTYTPFIAKMGLWWMLAGVWVVAAIGVFLKLFRPGRYDRLAILLYLALGWSGIVTYEHMVESLPPSVRELILAGGLVYSLGIIFHVWEKLRFQNVIWHGFVLVAASIHFVAVWYSVTA
ncbi:DNA-binding protein [Aureimonas sp. SA4125]|uniref:PAQR family membrane homeostasis protein TrhA n=1 Tax=Aureimonas sp. SA4125 TaxID=2826993 RepID=UPI001CC790F6|nr:hemolysin III family protein [Aureimonas sp. SA4125]BDA84180.1 DNA-binding protein [Aureimonas sp. SA4125]